MSTYRLELRNSFVHVARMVDSPHDEKLEPRFMLSEKGVADCSS